MGEWSWNALKQFIYERANGCCEYCQTCEANSGQTMQVDHIDPLFNPRTQVWSEHFAWIDGGTRVRGLSPIGRATVTRLRMNRPAMVVARQRWAEGGYHPPTIAR